MNFLKSWGIDGKQQNEILAFSIVDGIRYCVHNLFSYKNGMSFNSKRNYIRKMINHSQVQQLINYYNPITFSDRVYLFLIKNRMFRSIALASLIIKGNDN